MSELLELAKASGAAVVDSVIQRRCKIDPKTIVGAGKIKEICLNALHKEDGVLIFDRDLST